MTQGLRRWWRRPGGGAEVMRLAWPLILSNSFWTIQITIDRILLSQQSSEAGAAAMAASLIFWTPLTLFQFTVNYATTFVAQYTGAGRPERTGPAVWQAYRFALLSGVGCMGLVPLVETHDAEDLEMLAGDQDWEMVGINNRDLRTFAVDLATTERLLISAERHFAKLGFDGARLSDIAAEAGISRPSLLYHFESKEALYAAVVRTALLRLGEALVLEIEGRAPFPTDQQPIADIRIVDPNYFRAMGIGLRAGRFFGEGDTAQALRVMIINETMANRFWPNENPIGKRVTLGLPRPDNPWSAIVGVVRDVRRRTDESKPEPDWYLPYFRQPGRDMYLFVRAASDPASLASAAWISCGLAPASIRAFVSRLACARSRAAASRAFATFRRASASSRCLREPAFERSRAS